MSPEHADPVGRFTPRRTHWFFALGVQAYSRGDKECPAPPDTEAAAQWRYGWADAEEYARCADRHMQAELDANYCPAE